MSASCHAGKMARLDGRLCDMALAAVALPLLLEEVSSCDGRVHQRPPRSPEVPGGYRNLDRVPSLAASLPTSAPIRRDRVCTSRRSAQPGGRRWGAGSLRQRAACRFSGRMGRRGVPTSGRYLRPEGSTPTTTTTAAAARRHRTAQAARYWHHHPWPADHPPPQRAWAVLRCQRENTVICRNGIVCSRRRRRLSGGSRGKGPVPFIGTMGQSTFKSTFCRAEGLGTGTVPQQFGCKYALACLRCHT